MSSQKIPPLAGLNVLRAVCHWCGFTNSSWGLGLGLWGCLHTLKRKENVRKMWFFHKESCAGDTRGVLKQNLSRFHLSPPIKTQKPGCWWCWGQRGWEIKEMWTGSIAQRSEPGINSFQAGRGAWLAGNISSFRGRGHSQPHSTVHYFGCVTFARVTRCITGEEFCRWGENICGSCLFDFLKMFLFYFIFFFPPFSALPCPTLG